MGNGWVGGRVYLFDRGSLVEFFFFWSVAEPVCLLGKVDLEEEEEGVFVSHLGREVGGWLS